MELTIGLVGCGRWGTNHLATLVALREEGLLTRIVVSDADPDVLASVDSDATYPSFSAMLENEELNGVAIATPDITHLEMASLAAKHRLPMLVEKPLGSSVREVEDFFDTLPDDTILVIGYQLRHHNGLKRMMAAMNDMELGSFLLSYVRRTPRPKPAEADIVHALATHGLDTISFMRDTLLENMEVRDLDITESTARIQLHSGGSISLVNVEWGAEAEVRKIAVQGDLNAAMLDFGTGDLEWYVGEGFNQPPLLEQYNEPPLLSEWRFFLHHIHEQEPIVFPPKKSIIDHLSWIESNCKHNTG
ncbi:MAG: Gfo/Idh/MocA family protein [Poseidonia sp.]